MKKNVPQQFDENILWFRQKWPLIHQTKQTDLASKLWMPFWMTQLFSPQESWNLMTYFTWASILLLWGPLCPHIAANKQSTTLLCFLGCLFSFALKNKGREEYSSVCHFWGGLWLLTCVSILKQMVRSTRSMKHGMLSIEFWQGFGWGFDEVSGWGLGGELGPWLRWECWAASGASSNSIVKLGEKRAWSIWVESSE